MKQSLIKHIANIFDTLQISVPFEVYECAADTLPEWTKLISLTHDFLICCEMNTQKEKLYRFLGKEIFQHNNIIYWFEGDKVIEVEKNEFEISHEESDQKINYLKTETRLPSWLDVFIFNQLNAEYEPDYKHFDYNLNLTEKEILKYLGTYFPRSYAESFCIFDNIFQNKVYQQSISEKKYLNILSVGCGTGGDLIGLLTIIEKYSLRAIEINIWAIDGNGKALSVLEKIVNKFREKSSSLITLKIVKTVFESIPIIDLEQLNELKFDFILSFKLVCEIIALRKGQLDSSYYDFIIKFLPLLSDGGLCVLLDVTTKQEQTTFNPILMNKQINQALRELKDYQTLLPISCNLHDNECSIDCFCQQTFYITHQRHSKDKSKVAYRVIANKNFINLITCINKKTKLLINKDKCCLFTEANNLVEDAYLLKDKPIKGTAIETYEFIDISIPHKDEIQKCSDVLKQENNEPEELKVGSEIQKMGIKVVGRIDLSKFEKPKKEIKTDKENYYVIDTNVFVDCPDIITKINNKYHIILSAKVIDELDHLKMTLKEEGKKNVQKALKVINENINKRGIKMETADLNLIPIDFNKKSPDNFILSVALKFIDENPILLTSDNGLQVKAKGMNITTITLKEFLKQTKVN